MSDALSGLLALPSVGKLLKFAPLMGKRLDELDVNTVQNIITTLGQDVQVNEELVSAAVALLAGENVHTVAEMIQSPDSIQSLLGFVARGLNVSTSRYDEEVVIDVGSNAGSINLENTENSDDVNPFMGHTLYTAAPGWRLPLEKQNEQESNSN